MKKIFTTNWLREIQLKLETIMHKDYAYLVVVFLYFLFCFIPLTVVGIFFDCLAFTIGSSVLFSILRGYTSGFHMRGNLKCITFSCLIFPIFGYMSKQSMEDFLWVVFFIAILSARYLYEKAPLHHSDVELEKRWYNCKPFNIIKLETRKRWDTIKYDLEWHRKKFIHVLATYITLSFIMAYLGQIQACAILLWSIIMTAIMLFENKDEFL